MDACFISALNVCIDLSVLFNVSVFGNGFLNFHIIYEDEVGKVVRYLCNYMMPAVLVMEEVCDGLHRTLSMSVPFKSENLDGRGIF